MNKVDQKSAYELLDVLDGFLGDIRNALQDLCPSDTDSVFDVRRDCHIRIQNIEGKLEELKNAVGPDPVGGGNVMELRVGRKRVILSRDEDGDYKVYVTVGEQGPHLTASTSSRDVALYAFHRAYRMEQEDWLGMKVPEEYL